MGHPNTMKKRFCLIWAAGLGLFLTACEADARGRGGLEDRDYSQADLFRGAFAAAASIDAGAIASASEAGRIPRAIRRERERAVAAFRESFQSP